MARQDKKTKKLDPRVEDSVSLLGWLLFGVVILLFSWLTSCATAGVPNSAPLKITDSNQEMVLSQCYYNQNWNAICCVYGGETCGVVRCISDQKPEWTTMDRGCIDDGPTL